MSLLRVPHYSIRMCVKHSLSGEFFPIRSDSFVQLAGTSKITLLIVNILLKLHKKKKKKKRWLFPDVLLIEYLPLGFACLLVLIKSNCLSVGVAEATFMVQILKLMT
jgi:hypothetical protein